MTRGPNPDRWIPVEECLDRQLYLIRARNLRLGFYRAETKSFYGIRTKFGRRYVDDEDHWDTGAPYGTAKPLQKLDGWKLRKDLDWADTKALWGNLVVAEDVFQEPNLGER